MWDSSFWETTLGLRCLTDSSGQHETLVKVNSVRAQGSQGSVRPCSFFREWLNDEVGEGMVGTGALIGHVFLRDQSRL